MCDCEAGLDHYVDPADTPDGRIVCRGSVYAHDFLKTVERHLKKVLLHIAEDPVLFMTAYDHLPSDTYFKLAKDRLF